jgi:hypothetical protein
MMSLVNSVLKTLRPVVQGYVISVSKIKHSELALVVLIAQIDMTIAQLK